MYAIHLQSKFLQPPMSTLSAEDPHSTFSTPPVRATQERPSPSDCVSSLELFVVRRQRRAPQLQPIQWCYAQVLPTNARGYNDNFAPSLQNLRSAVNMRLWFELVLWKCHATFPWKAQHLQCWHKRPTTYPRRTLLQHLPITTKNATTGINNKLNPANMTISTVESSETRAKRSALLR